MQITEVFLIQKGNRGILKCMVKVKGEDRMKVLRAHQVPLHLLDRYYEKYPDTPLPSAQDMFGATNPNLAAWMEQKNVGQALPMNTRYVELDNDKVYRLGVGGLKQNSA